MAGGVGDRAPISTSYRARRPGGDPGMRAMTIAAVALGGVLLVGMGGWALMGRKPAAVPVIEADSRPLRVKPEHAGGMQVAGADEQVLGGQGTSGGDRMAPSPEAPAPQALRAQMQQGAASGTAAPPVAVAPVAPAPGVSPLPDTPLRQQPAARPTPVVVAAPPAAALPLTAPRVAPASGTLVQLAAVDSEAGAQAEWARLSKRMPELLGDRRAVVQKAERDGRAVWRVRTGGFGDVAEATGFCAKVKAKGGGCVIAGS